MCSQKIIFQNDFYIFHPRRMSLISQMCKIILENELGGTSMDDLVMCRKFLIQQYLRD